MKKHLLITLLAAVLTANSGLAFARINVPDSNVINKDVASVTEAAPLNWYDKLLSRVITRPKPPKH